MQDRFATRVICACLLALAAVPAYARTLYWSELSVDAHLDNNGRLRVIERHQMVFDGDWNGGERRFRVEQGQQFRFMRISQIEATTGEAWPLTLGDLSAVGHYKFFGDHLVRWRARLPSDPPFRSTELVYEIEYELGRIVRKSGDRYILDHDFAFPDRPGDIRRFAVRLTLDSAWQTSSNSTHVLERDNLRPGANAVVRLMLDHIGDAEPTSIAPTFQSSAPLVSTASDTTLIKRPTGWNYALLVVVALFAAVRVVAWYRSDRACGKFEPLVPIEHINRRWLEEHILKHRPEVVGAAWDLDTSAHEVAAVLARMTQEGKLESSIQTRGIFVWKRDILQLKLLCERTSLRSYERRLIDALFVGPGNTADTDALRRRYESRGFDPAQVIAPYLALLMKGFVDKDSQSPSPTSRFTATSITSGILLLLVAVVIYSEAELVSLAFAALLLGAWLVGNRLAARYRAAVDELLNSSLRALVVVFVLVLTVWVSSFLAFVSWRALHLIAFALITVGVINSILNAMRCNEALDSLRFRKVLAAGRRYFVHELRARKPKLDDSWFPYLIAFGLGPNVDQWFKSNRRWLIGHDVGLHTVGEFNFATTSNSPTSWTGGGGAFGGAGASGSWATAISSIAASIPEPASTDSGSSSGSSDGGGGGGGGSSGGGGGGGW